MKAKLKAVMAALMSPEARPAEFALARIIIGALGATELVNVLRAFGIGI